MHHSENTAFSWDDNLTVVYCKDRFWQDCLSQTHQPNCPAGMDEDSLSGSDICKGQTEHWNDLTSRKLVIAGANRDGDQTHNEMTSDG